MPESSATSELLQKKREIERRYGDWTSANIALGDGTFTMGPEANHDTTRLRRVLQTVADVSGRPIAELRVLDLACCEGLFSIEFALHGAEVVAVEGREANLEKARFVRETLNLTNLTLRQDDVRNINVESYGRFDVVLCLGILYHLDVPDVFQFLETISKMCSGCLVIDTHSTLMPSDIFTWNGERFLGKRWREHAQESTSNERTANVWASLDNDHSVFLSKPTIVKLLAQFGFTAVVESLLPIVVDEPARITLVALRGAPQKLLSGSDQWKAASPPFEKMPSRLQRLWYRFTKRRWFFQPKPAPNPIAPTQ